jgi:metallophosphoesterase (TIGR00282 family)
MRLLFIGDIVGSPGVQFVRDAVPVLRSRLKLDLVVANAENASGGSGMYPNVYKKLREAGVDLVTMGDHIYKRGELIATLRADDRICKPANFPAAAPGRDVILAPAADGTPVAVISLLGRTFMRPATDCPFAAADRVLAGLGRTVRCVLVDVHAEATADKYLLLHHLKGRVSAVLGTHTHVPTADEHVRDGTAFICDVGMTGPYSGVLGRRADRVLAHATSLIPLPFEVDEGDVRLGGAVVDVDPDTGRATAIRRVMVAPDDLAVTPPPAAP